MAKGEKFIGELGIEARPKEKIDVKKIKKSRKKGNGGGDNDADLGLAERKFRQEREGKRIARDKEKLKRKEINGYTGGKGLQDTEQDMGKIIKGTESKDAVLDRKETIKTVDPNKTIEDLKREENDLMQQIQGLPQGRGDDSVWEEKKSIIAKLEANREEQQKMTPDVVAAKSEEENKIVLEKSKKSNNQKPEILKEFGSNYGDIISKEPKKTWWEKRSDWQEYLSAPKKEKKEENEKYAEFYRNELEQPDDAGIDYSKVNKLGFKKQEDPQKYFTDEYSKELEEKQEMDVFTPKPSPELMQETMAELEKDKRNSQERISELERKLAEMEAKMKKEAEKTISVKSQESPAKKELWEKTLDKLLAQKNFGDPIMRFLLSEESEEAKSKKEKILNEAEQINKKDFEDFITNIGDTAEEFREGHIGGEEVIWLAKDIKHWSDELLKDNVDFRKKAVKEIRKIFKDKSDLLAKILEAMVKFGIENKIDSEEIAELSCFLAMRSNPSEIEGLDEKTKQWLKDNSEKNEENIAEKDVEAGEYRLGEKDIKHIENFFNDFREKKIGGKEVLEFAKQISGGKTEDPRKLLPQVLEKIFSYDQKLRGKMVDAMAAYADETGISNKEVAEKYLPYFEVSQHIGRADVYKWLIGEIDRLLENEEKNKKEQAGKNERWRKEIDAVFTENEIRFIKTTEVDKLIADIENNEILLRQDPNKEKNEIAEIYHRALVLIWEDYDKDAGAFKGKLDLNSIQDVFGAGNENASEYFKALFERIKELTKKDIDKKPPDEPPSPPEELAVGAEKDAEKAKKNLSELKDLIDKKKKYINTEILEELTNSASANIKEKNPKVAEQLIELANDLIRTESTYKILKELRDKKPQEVSSANKTILLDFINEKEKILTNYNLGQQSINANRFKSALGSILTSEKIKKILA